MKKRVLLILTLSLLLIVACEPITETSSEDIEVSISTISNDEESEESTYNEEELSEYEKYLIRHAEGACETDQDCIDYYGDEGYECIPFGEDDYTCYYTATNYTLSEYIGFSCGQDTDPDNEPETPGYSTIVDDTGEIIDIVRDDCGESKFTLVEYLCGDEGFLTYKIIDCREYCNSNNFCFDDPYDNPIACINLGANYDGDACQPPE